jgi:hypothetical protein
MVINIQPVKLDGQHWVNVIIGGHEIERRGPFLKADTAEIVGRTHAPVQPRADE